MPKKTATQEISRVSRPRLYEQTFIAAMILKTRLESLGQPGRPEQSLASHRKIADAIRAQDPATAAAAMLEHIELVSDVALLKQS